MLSETLIFIQLWILIWCFFTKMKISMKAATIKSDVTIMMIMMRVNDSHSVVIVTWFLSHDSHLLFHLVQDSLICQLFSVPVSILCLRTKWTNISDNTFNVWNPMITITLPASLCFLENYSVLDLHNNFFVISEGSHYQWKYQSWEFL